MKRKRLFLVISAAWVLATSSGCQKPPNEEFVVVPLEQVHDRMLHVRVSVGGKDLLFLVDTGAAVTAVDMRLIDQLDLPPPCKHTPHANLVTGSASTQHFHDVPVKIGKITNVFGRFEAVDLSSVMPSVDDLATNGVGVLGADFFHDSDAAIDFSARELRIPVSSLNVNKGEPISGGNR